MSRYLGEFRLALDLWRAQREGPFGLTWRQDLRLTEMVAHARSKSGYYRHLYRNLPAEGFALSDLPPVTKPELMAAFDEWVTDPDVNRAGVEAFISDPKLIGTRFRNEFFVCTSSGTTGHPGIFVHDLDAMSVYQAITIARIDIAWFAITTWLQLVRRRIRMASVVGTGGHFVGAGWTEWQRHRGPWRSKAFRVFSVQAPIDELAKELESYNPAVLAGYPSALELLAQEQVAGRLRLQPLLVEIAGESPGPGARTLMEEAFGCPIHNEYGSSEFPPLAFDCAHGWSHVSSDWAILEPVDASYRPTPIGEPSHTVLLTNLANRIQPIIRYDLGDSVLFRADPCPCGSPLPAIRVAGRQDDVLLFDGIDGRKVTILPLAISAVVEETPGVNRSQLVQTSESTISLRLEPKPGVAVERLWSDAISNIKAYLLAQHLPNIEIVRASEPPEQSISGGKFRQVIAARSHVGG